MSVTLVCPNGCAAPPHVDRVRTVGETHFSEVTYCSACSSSYPQLRHSFWGGELTPPYATICADPPWAYDEGWPAFGDKEGEPHRRRPLPYSSMTVEEIAAMPVADIAADDSHLYLWTTNRYLRDAFDIADAWGFRFSTLLTWCKPPMGMGPGGAYALTTEFVLYCRRGKLAPKQRMETTYWLWSRGAHSEKPAAFMDIVETVSPGPYVELFARAPRLGWDSWGHGYEAERSAG